MRQGMTLLFCAALAACGSSSSTANQYKATLTFANEIPTPPVPSTGSGFAALSDNGTGMSYTITVSGLTSAVTASHIHSGSATQGGGPIIVTLTPPTSGTSAGSFTAPNAGAKDINQNPVTTYADVLTLIKSGNTYVNVHTSSNQGGEVRGQIVAQ